MFDVTFRDARTTGCCLLGVGMWEECPADHLHSLVHARMYLITQTGLARMHLDVTPAPGVQVTVMLCMPTGAATLR